MFSKLIKNNARRNRQENGMFFSSMVMSVIAFYIILSMENHDVIRFLRTLESDAISKIIALTPIFFGFSLVLLLVLVFYSNKIQLENRSHEFGVYLTLGMKKSKLFFMILLEDIKNSILAIILGLAIGITLTELISLVSAKLVGIGIIGHTFSISFKANDISLLSNVTTKE